MRLVRLETYIAALIAMTVPVPLPAVGAAQGAAGMTGAAAGIEWTVPGTWTKGRGSSMRVATYDVPAAKEAEAAECAVFYFGRGQGGGIDDNVKRWARQFRENPTPGRTRRTVAGVSVTLVDVEGTYLNPGGGTMQSRGEKPDYRLLGAIVEAPAGRVFFKLTGPRTTIAAAQADFDALIGSIEGQ